MDISRPSAGESGILIASAVLFLGALLGLHFGDGPAWDAMWILFVIPIALCAMTWGLRGGLLATAGAIVLLVYSDLLLDAPTLGPLGIATIAASYLVVGAMLGRFVDQRRIQERKLAGHFGLSLDLFCTATFDGYFEDLNPAWERTLGYTIEELWSRPFLEFVHPDDREATEAETLKLASGMASISFRNRYRTADGDYRWLEWNVQPDAEDRKLYATARDISAQKEAEQALQHQSLRLEQTVRDRTRELEESRLEVLQRLAVAGEYRDDDTYQHTERVGRTAARIARQLGLPRDEVNLIRRAAPLHDIGKVGVPDAVLLKPGKLTAEEYKLVKDHVEIGAKILSQGRFSVLHVARTIALTHHERWDGRGYPYGLVGADIPLVGRITAVADVFDALTHARPYKPAWTVQAAVAEIEGGAGDHFDPEVVEAFMALDHARLLHPVGGLRPQRASPARKTSMRSFPSSTERGRMSLGSPS